MHQFAHYNRGSLGMQLSSSTRNTGDTKSRWKTLQHSSFRPSLKVWCRGVYTTDTRVIKTQIPASHPSPSPPQFLSISLHFKQGCLGGSTAGVLNLGFTGTPGQGSQVMVCLRVTWKVGTIQTLESNTYRFFLVRLEAGQRACLHF